VFLNSIHAFALDARQSGGSSDVKLSLCSCHHPSSVLSFSSRFFSFSYEHTSPCDDCNTSGINCSGVFNHLEMSSEAAKGINEAANRAGAAVSSASSNITQSTAGTWDRFSQWVSDNKAVAYTIAGVTLVATGGAVYFYTAGGGAAPKPKDSGVERISKKERRKIKKDLEDEAAAAQQQAAAQGKRERIPSDGLLVTHYIRYRDETSCSHCAE